MTEPIINPDTIRQMEELFSNTQNPDNELQKQVRKQLISVADKPEFLVHACAIFANKEGSSLNVRFVAAVCIKSVLTKEMTPLDPGTQAYLESKIPTVFVEENSTMRRAAIFCIVALIIRAKVVNAENNLAFLLEAISKGNNTNVGDAVECFALIFEDLNVHCENFQNLESILESKLVEDLVDKLFILIAPDKPENVRIKSLKCLSNIITSMAPKINRELERLVLSLIELIQGSSDDIRKHIYAILLSACSMNKMLFISNSKAIFSVLSQALCDPSIPARKTLLYVFWEYCGSNGGHDDDEYNHIAELRPYIQQILEGLIDNLTLTPDDVENMAESRLYSNEKFDCALLLEEDHEEQEVNQFFEGDDREEDDEYKAVNYTCRKISGEAIGKILNHFGESTFTMVAQKVVGLLRSSDPEDREKAVLYIGIVASDAVYAFKSEIESLVPTLLELCISDNEYISSGAIWTFSKFLKEIAISETELCQGWMLKYLEVIFQGMQSQSARVQDSCSTAFGKLLKCSVSFIDNHKEVIVPLFIRKLEEPLPTYFILDALSAFFSNFTEDSQTLVLAKAFAGILLAKLESINFSEYHQLYISLLECAAQLVRTSKMHMQQFINNGFDAVVNASIKIIDYLHTQSGKKSFSKLRAEYNNQMTSILVRCLDFIGAICENMHTVIPSLISAPRIADILKFAITLENVETKMFSFGTIGDLSTIYPDLIRPEINSYLNVLIEHCYCLPSSVDPGYYTLSLCANSIYALGKIVEKFPAEFHQHLPELLKKIENIYMMQKMHSTLAINLSIFLGKLGLIYPKEVAEGIDHSIKKICVGFCFGNSGAEDLHPAFKGLIRMVKTCPQMLLPDLPFYLEAIAKYKNPPPETYDQFMLILKDLASTASTQEILRQSITKTSKVAQTILQNNYNLH